MKRERLICELEGDRFIASYGTFTTANFNMKEWESLSLLEQMSKLTDMLKFTFERGVMHGMKLESERVIDIGNPISWAEEYKKLMVYRGDFKDD